VSRRYDQISPITTDIDKLIRDVHDVASGFPTIRDVPGRELIYAFKYAKYPFTTYARPSKVKRLASKKLTLTQKRSRLQMSDVLRHRLSKRLKVRLTLREDGGVYVRIDHQLYSAKAFGFAEWSGAWKFLTTYDLIHTLTPGDIADAWMEHGFMVRYKFKRTKGFRVMQVLKKLGGEPRNA
jgi:hypothetical protein